MKISNYIFIVIGLLFILIGVLFILIGVFLENTNYVFFDNETTGYLGFFLYLLGLFIFLFQFIVWLICLLISIFKELWNEYKNKR